MTTDPHATCAACGAVRVDGRCPGCREAVARAAAAVDAREATDPLLETIEAVLVDGIEAEPGIRLRLGWPKLAAEVLAAVEATGRLIPVEAPPLSTIWGNRRVGGVVADWEDEALARQDVAEFQANGWEAMLVRRDRVAGWIGPWTEVRP